VAAVTGYEYYRRGMVETAETAASRTLDQGGDAGIHQYGPDRPRKGFEQLLVLDNREMPTLAVHCSRGMQTGIDDFSDILVTHLVGKKIPD
jgi:hypothetical protein